MLSPINNTTAQKNEFDPTDVLAVLLIDPNLSVKGYLGMAELVMHLAFNKKELAAAFTLRTKGYDTRPFLHTLCFQMREALGSKFPDLAKLAKEMQGFACDYKALQENLNKNKLIIFPEINTAGFFQAKGHTWDELQKMGDKARAEMVNTPRAKL